MDPTLSGLHITRRRSARSPTHNFTRSDGHNARRYRIVGRCSDTQGNHTASHAAHLCRSTSRSRLHLTSNCFKTCVKCNRRNFSHSVYHSFSLQSEAECLNRHSTSMDANVRALCHTTHSDPSKPIAQALLSLQPHTAQNAASIQISPSSQHGMRSLQPPTAQNAWAQPKTQPPSRSAHLLSRALNVLSPGSFPSTLCDVLLLARFAVSLFSHPRIRHAEDNISEQKNHQKI